MSAVHNSAGGDGIAERIIALLPLEKNKTKSILCHSDLDAELYTEAELNMSGAQSFVTPHTVAHCLTPSPCLAVLYPKTFLVGQVLLSPVCPMSRKV